MVWPQRFAAPRCHFLAPPALRSRVFLLLFSSPTTTASSSLSEASPPPLPPYKAVAAVRGGGAISRLLSPSGERPQKPPSDSVGARFGSCRGASSARVSRPSGPGASAADSLSPLVVDWLLFWLFGAVLEALRRSRSRICVYSPVQGAFVRCRLLFGL